VAESDFTYRAFISYAHADHPWAVWLHRALERYRVPRRLAGAKGLRRLGKMFRDEEELAAAAELGPKIDAALKASDVLIVVCSPRSAKSKWVNQEIEAFKRQGREHRVFALIVDGEPHDPAQECFPEALKRRADGGPAEPLAVDVRKFGRSDAVVRIIAGLLDVGYDDLHQRELRRRRAERRAAEALFATGLVLVIAALTGGWFAYTNYMTASDRNAALFAREAHGLADEGAAAKGILLALYGDPAAQAGPVEHFSRPGGYANVRAALDHAYVGNRLARAFSSVPFPIDRAARTNDGHIVFARNAKDMLQGWDIDSGKLLASIPLHTVEPFALSPDGKTVMTGHFNGSVALWRTADGVPLRTFQANEGQFSFVGFSRDGAVLMTGGMGGAGKLWRLDGQPVAALTGHTSRVDSMELSADGQRVLTRSGDQTTKLWAASGGPPIASYTPQDLIAPHAAFSPDGSMFVVGGPSWAVELRRSSDAALVKTFVGHQSGLVYVAFTKDGSRLLTAADTVRLWPLDGSEPKIFNSGSILETADISPDGSYVVTGGRDNLVRLWNAYNPRVLEIYSGHDGPVSRVQFSSDGQRILSDAWDGSANIWEVTSSAKALVLSGHKNGLSSVQYSKDGKLVLTGSADGTANLWKAEGGDAIMTFTGHEKPIVAAALSPDGATVVTAGFDGKAKLWRAATGELITDLVGHSLADAIFSASFSPDGTLVLTGSTDGAAALWSAKTGELIRSFQHPDGAIYGTAFFPDGKHFVAGFQGGAARVWSIEGGDPVLTLVGHTNNARAVAVSPDGRMIATGSRDNTTKLWDAVSGELLMNLSGYAGEIEAVAFSPDSKYVATAGLDGAARIWSVDGGRVIETFARPGSVESVAFSPDGKSLLIAANGGVAEIWPIDPFIRETPGRHVELACERLKLIGMTAFSEQDYGRLPLLDRKAPNPCAHIWAAKPK
jgi:WD40 repeat protein